jgi:peptidoglycan LD-endopeptidase LytH
VLSWDETGGRIGNAASSLGFTPHDRYAAGVRLRRFAASIPVVRRWSGSSEDAAAWLAAAERALTEPHVTRVPASFSATAAFDGAGDVAAWRLPIRRGYRMVVSHTGAHRVFIDLFDASTRIRLASADSNQKSLRYDTRADGELLVRVQPALHQWGEYAVTARAEASLEFPVGQLTPRAIQSRFGASRDAGRRLHEGIDIFASRGTPVRAAADGWVGSSLTNGLGGNVIWVWTPLRGIRTYYAHLDRHAASPGEHVSAGDIVGYVGNTGNARGGPPHLHFGVYMSGEGSVDPLPYVCGDTCFR